MTLPALAPEICREKLYAKRDAPGEENINDCVFNAVYLKIFAFGDRKVRRRFPSCLFLCRAAAHADPGLDTALILRTSTVEGGKGAFRRHWALIRGVLSGRGGGLRPRGAAGGVGAGV